MKPCSFVNKLSVALCSVALLLTGCPSPQDQAAETSPAKHLNIISIYAPATFDPHIEPNWFMINSGVVETLVRVNEKLELEPWLAKSWSSEDGQHWQIEIQPNVKFHNGQPMTAEAVKASLERSIQMNPAVKTALRIKSINVDGQRLNIETENIHPAFISELVHPNTVILDAKAPNMAEKPIATGPYRVDSTQTLVGADLSKNPDYWDGEVQIDRISFKGNTDANARLLALQSGEADIIYRPSAESLATLKSVQSVVIDSVEGARVYYLLHNYEGPNAKLMNNAAFRKGLDTLIDREAIVSSVMQGEGVVAQGPFLPKFAFSPDYQPKHFDIQQALTYFAEAGLTVQGGQVSQNGQPVSLNLAVYTARAEFPTIAQIIQDTAKKIGIQVNIQVVERIEEYLPNAKWDLATYALVTVPRGDASYFLNAACYPGRFLNFGHMNVPEINTLVDQLNKTVDEEERNQLAKAAATLIDQKTLHANYITYPKVTTAYHKKVKGWVTFPHELYLVTKNLRIEEN